MDNKKKPSKEQLERRIEKALLHIDKTKDTKSIYFSDKGLRLTANEDYAIIETGFHRHVFNNITSSGVSRPYLYTMRAIDIAAAHIDEIQVKGADGSVGYSYARLIEVLNELEDKTDYNTFWYFDKYLYSIFCPLYSIGESEEEAWMTYFRFAHNVAMNAVILEERTDDVTNKEFFEKYVETFKSFIAEADERVVLRKPDVSDEENAEAMREFEDEAILNEELKNGDVEG